ncbi:MAG: hypothetical protein QM784_27655 [Polyangiaceae bacterium]
MGRKLGDPHSIELSASTIRDAEDAVFGTVLVFRDVTERREHEARKLEVTSCKHLGSWWVALRTSSTTFSLAR